MLRSMPVPITIATPIPTVLRARPSLRHIFGVALTGVGLLSLLLLTFELSFNVLSALFG